MIRAVIVMNTQGKPRFAKFYDFQVPLWGFLWMFFFLVLFVLFLSNDLSDDEFSNSACREAAGAHSECLWRLAILYFD